jgi:DNA topoisomerase IB
MDVTKTLRDAAYVTIGLGVLGFQRAQVRRVELQKQVLEQVEVTRAQVEQLTKTLQDRLDPVLDQVEERLPDQAGELVKQARATAKDVQGQVKALVARVVPAAA